MLQYELKKKESETNGFTRMRSYGMVTLTDDARGADKYLALKRRGFELTRIQPMACDGEEQD